MRVARLYGVGDLRVDEEPILDAPAGHSLVRVTAVGICGSDLHWFAEGGIGDAGLTAPLVLGHECAGVVEQGPLAGRRVAIDPAIPCGVCETCRRGWQNLCPEIRFAGHGVTDGALRDVMAWPDHLLHPLPDGVSDVAGAMLEPLGVALHAVDLGHVRAGGSVAIVGCGPIGLLAVQLVRAVGAATVVAVEPLAHRRRAALGFGADIAMTPEQAHAGALEDVRVDVAIEIAGTDDAIAVAMQAAAPGARVVLAGIPDTDRSSFPASVARRKGLTILMSRRMNGTYPRATALVRRGRIEVEPIVTDRFELARADAAFTAAAGRTGLKTVVEIRPR
jgi:L-iditol 2-dehydrogenase